MNLKWIEQERTLWDAMQHRPLPRIDKNVLNKLSSKERKKIFQDREKLEKKIFAREWSAYREWVTLEP